MTSGLIAAVHKTVFVFGHFNVLHPGHVRLLRFAKECGERLVVGVESDKIAGDAAHVREHLRLEGVQSISWVDEAFLVDTSITDVIRRIKPDVVVKGKEHELSFNEEESLILSYGGRLLFSSGDARFSSLDLIQREFQAPGSSTIKCPHEYLNRHEIRKDHLASLIDQFKNLKVCVIGDLIVDEYITCQPLGMSREDPTIVVSPINSKQFLGGAGIVAAHAAAMGAEVHYLSVSGDDVSRRYAIERLNAEGVKAQIFIDESRPTTLKQRFRSQGKSLLRVNHLHQDAISTSLQQRLFLALSALMAQVDLVVFSDFNYGCLPQPLVDRLVAVIAEQKVMMVADSQSSSQVGDIGRFKKMSLITPTEHEARLSTRDADDGLVILAEKLRQQSQAENVFLKLGEEGLLIHARGTKYNNWSTDRIDALNDAPKDVAGAGDSMLIAGALTIKAGGSIWDAGYLGSLAAAIQVGRVGNTPIRAEELLKRLY
jgi:rfaE bifunctional protein kinase chain/domain